MRSNTVRPSIRSMLVTIPGLFICLMVIPPSSFADPYCSIGLSDGSAGINGFTLSISDYGGIPVVIERDGPQYGRAYERRMPHHMNRPNEYPRNDYRQTHYRQNMSRPDQDQHNGPLQNQQRQNIDKQKREKQHQWEMSMMNKGMTFPR